MNIVTLLGSPRRNGNTAAMADMFNRTASDTGAIVESFYLNQMDIKGCQACDACKTTTEYCVIKDDMTVVLNAVKNADAVVAATPIYFADVTAQFKVFIDRCYSFLKPFERMPTQSRLEPGKQFVLITAQNREAELFEEVCTKYLMIAEFLGFKKTYLIRGCDLMKADAIHTKHRRDLFDAVQKTAKAVLNLR